MSDAAVLVIDMLNPYLILYSALDAYVWHFDVVVPADAVAHIDAHLGEAALQMMQRNMGAQVLSADGCLR